MIRMMTLGVGTDADRGGRGIYGLLTGEDGRFSGEARLLSEQKDVSCFCYDSERGVLYAGSAPEGGEPGLAAAYRTASLKLACFSCLVTAGGPLTHAAMPPARDRLAVCSGQDASVQIYPLGEEGDLQPLFCMRRHAERSTGPERRERRIGSAAFTPDGRYAVVCDQGTDQLVVYYMDRDSTKLRLEREKTFCLPPGTGPRDLLFSPDGRQAYVTGQHSHQLLILVYDPEQGFSLQDQRETGKSPEGLRLTANGRDLYTVNRDEGTITHFRLTEEGLADRQESLPVGGTPRDLILGAEDRYLICALQEPDRLISLRRDPETGNLEPLDEYGTVPGPCCLQLWEALPRDCGEVCGNA